MKYHKVLPLIFFGLAVGFTLGNAQPESPVLNDNQLKMVVSGADIQAGLDLVTGPNPPQYLQLLNEPDGGFYDLPVYSPQEAYDLIKPFLEVETTTTFLSPAPAYPHDPWLTDFFNICNCADKFPVILAHVYSVDAPGAIATIQTVMDQFPGKPVWVTEISPASDPSQNCGLDPQGMISWMNEVIGWAAQQPLVERVFWNCGEYVSPVLFYKKSINFGKTDRLFFVGHSLPRSKPVQPKFDKCRWVTNSLA